MEKGEVVGADEFGFKRVAAEAVVQNFCQNLTSPKVVWECYSSQYIVGSIISQGKI